MASRGAEDVIFSFANTPGESTYPHILPNRERVVRVEITEMGMTLPVSVTPFDDVALVGFDFNNRGTGNHYVQGDLVVFPENTNDGTWHREYKRPVTVYKNTTMNDQNVLTMNIKITDRNGSPIDFVNVYFRLAIVHAKPDANIMSRSIHTLGSDLLRNVY